MYVPLVNISVAFISTRSSLHVMSTSGPLTAPGSIPPLSLPPDKKELSFILPFVSCPSFSYPSFLVSFPVATSRSFSTKLLCFVSLICCLSIQDFLHVFSFLKSSFQPQPPPFWLPCPKWHSCPLTNPLFSNIKKESCFILFCFSLFPPMCF